MRADKDGEEASEVCCDSLLPEVERKQPRSGRDVHQSTQQALL